MKNLKLLATALLLFIGINTLLAQVNKETIKVSGNCGKCARHIETAALKAGASEAKWNKDNKVLKVSYYASKTTNDAIQKRIAAAGYDTEKYPGDNEAYAQLDECCQYDNKRK